MRPSGRGSYFWLLLRATKWRCCHLLLCLIWKKMMYVSKYRFSVSRILLPYHCCIYPSNLFHTHTTFFNQPPHLELCSFIRVAPVVLCTEPSLKHRNISSSVPQVSAWIPETLIPPAASSRMAMTRPSWRPATTINHFWGERSGFSLNTSENFQRGWIQSPPGCNRSRISSL